MDTGPIRGQSNTVIHATMTTYNRRSIIAGAGGIVLASLAGCLGDDDDDDADDADDDNGEDDPESVAVDWVSAASNFDDEGDIEDHTGEDSVTVENGNQVDGNYVYEPPVIRIDAGTEVEWEWTSSGHNVEEVSGQGETISDWGQETSIEDEGHTHSTTFDDEGVALYECGPHRGQNQRGAVIVE